MIERGNGAEGGKRPERATDMARETSGMASDLMSELRPPALGPYGASLTIESAPRVGTQVYVEVPDPAH